jgi:hypothetical protein
MLLRRTLVCREGGGGALVAYGTHISGNPTNRGLAVDPTITSELPPMRDLHRSSSVPMTSIGERIQLEQSEMIRILRLQRAHQNLKCRKLA